MKQCKNYLIFMVPCYIFQVIKIYLNWYKQNRNVNIIIMKMMIAIILMMIILIMIIIIVIIIALMIMMIKIILIIVVVIIIIINYPFQPGDFSTGSTTDTCKNVVEVYVLNLKVAPIGVL